MPTASRAKKYWTLCEHCSYESLHSETRPMACPRCGDAETLVEIWDEDDLRDAWETQKLVERASRESWNRTADARTSPAPRAFGSDDDPDDFEIPF
ncbi:MAG: hypothetical protein JOZ53_03465 [Planctomycetaceae bacterium]|nr:hypothetical protein [Planctomycetaceae bacterium]